MLQRIPKQKKEAFNLLVMEYKERLDQINKKIKKYEREGMAGNDINAKYKRIIAAHNYLSTVGLYCEMNDKSVEIMNIKNDAYLGNARKNIYQAIKLLESLVGTYIDTGMSENEEILNELQLMTPLRILNTLSRIENGIILVELEEGENSKWKWNFVELYGRFAVLCKNMINFKAYIPKMGDPRAPYFQQINSLFRMVKRVADEAAQRYRKKYELSSRDVADMNKAIDLLQMLVKIHTILNEPDNAHEVKKVVEKWKEKLEYDLKKKDEEAKKRQKAGIK